MRQLSARLCAVDLGGQRPPLDRGMEQREETRVAALDAAPRIGSREPWKREQITEPKECARLHSKKINKMNDNTSGCDNAPDRFSCLL